MTDRSQPIEVQIRHQCGSFSLDVSLRLPAAGVSVVFGPSGAGKSTLLRVIAGLEAGASGFIRVRGQTWLNTHIALPAHQRHVGMVFQHSALLPHLSVHDNLRYGWRRGGGDAALLQKWIDRLGLDPLLARRPDTLAGGEMQRVALARALVSQPRWLLLDEPLSALDEPRRAEILPYLEAIKRDTDIPLLYVSHSVEEVVRLADHLVLLDGGRVTASGPALALLNSADSPLALREDGGVVLPASVRDQDASGLLSLVTAGFVLHAHGPQLVAGSPVRVRIQARDVSLALSAHTDTSVLNILPATVVELSAVFGGQVQVRVDATGAPLLARISQHSADRLALQPGMQVWAQIKAAALLV